MGFQRRKEKTGNFESIPAAALEKRPPRARWMTSDEVLQVLVDIWRQYEGIDENPHTVIPIQRETNIESAMNSLKLGKWIDDWPSIALMLKGIFRVELEPEQWKAVLHPKQEKTLGPVCDLIAEHALAPMIEQKFGSVRFSWATAAFRAILLLLQEASIEIKDITPDTRLTGYLTDHTSLFLTQISRLSPGKLPALRYVSVWRRIGYAGGLVALLVILLQTWIFSNLFAIFGCVACLIGLIAIFIPGPKSTRWSCLGGLRTFGDLAFALTSPPPSQSNPCEHEDGTYAYWDDSCQPSSFIYP